MGWLKKLGSFTSKYTPLGGFGTFESMFKHGDPDSPAGKLAGAVGYDTPAYKGAEKGATDKARAEAEAAERQALFEASTRAGLERLAMKRRRGFGASMIVNPVLSSVSTLGA